MLIFDSSPATSECRLQGGIAILRVSLGAFLLVWAVMKFVVPAGTIGIFRKFYGLDIDADIAMVLGILQAALALAILVGYLRTWSYGGGLVMHAYSRLASWRETLDPWGVWLGGSPKMLFWAGVPVLAAFVFLWLVRDLDRLSVDGLQSPAREQ